MKRPVTSDEKGKESGCGRSSAVDHAMRLLIMQSFSHLRALFVVNSLYTLHDDKLLECNEVK